MFCNNCGNEITDNAVFCTICGVKLRPFGDAPSAPAAVEKAELPPPEEAAPAEAVRLPNEAAYPPPAPTPPEAEPRIPQSAAAFVRAQPQPERFTPPVYPEPMEKPKRVFGTGSIVFCLILIALLSISTGVFAGLYFALR